MFVAENVALGKTCRMSSKLQAQNDYAAVNNNTSGIYDNSTNCIHTGRGDKQPWWQVDLGRPYPVYNITIWARTHCECVCVCVCARACVRVRVCVRACVLFWPFNLQWDTCSYLEKKKIYIYNGTR